ncbi:MAG: ADP-ribosylglycohydrolase family protein [Desulfurococcales archaeon]|nr:ADP-ribosylglycohydrolase family protein [Desulfurococcales archaeon]
MGTVLGDVYSLYWRFCILKPRPRWSLDDELLGSLDLCGGKLCYSYVTELMLLLTEELIENDRVRPESLATRLACRAKLGRDVRCYDPALALIFRNIRKGVPWEVASREVSTVSDLSNCAAATRVAPITILFDSLSDVIEEVTKQALITNYDECAVEGALIFAIAQYLVTKDVEDSRLVRELLKHTDGRAFKVRLLAIPKLLDEEPITVAKVIGNSSRAYEAVPAAIYCYLKSGGDPVRAIKYSVSLGGDVSDIAVMSASLAAAASGVDQDIMNLLLDVENLDTILQLLQTLISKKSGSQISLKTLINR